jgi:hypothetical protein
MSMAVVVPVTITARTDGFIDNLMQVFLDTPDNLKRAPHAVPLAIHVTSRPHAGPSEPIQRRSLLSDVILIAEGTPEEIQAVLGWSIDTRRLLLSLPTNKFDAWMLDIKQISSAGKTTFGNLDTTVGRLNHAAYVIPLARHFLNRLRSRLLFRKPKTQEITLSRHESKDLALWRHFLIMAHDGLPTKPTDNPAAYTPHFLRYLPIQLWRIQSTRTSMANSHSSPLSPTRR